MADQTYELHLSVTASQMLAIATVLAGAGNAAVSTTQSGSAPETASKKAASPSKPKADVAESAAQPEVTGKDAAGGEVAEVPTTDEVKQAAMALSAKNGRDAVVELCSKYGAQNISGIPEDKRAEFIAAAAQ